MDLERHFLVSGAQIVVHLVEADATLNGICLIIEEEYFCHCIQINIKITFASSPTVISWTDLIIENHADICSLVNLLSLANMRDVKNDLVFSKDVAHKSLAASLEI